MGGKQSKIKQPAQGEVPSPVEQPLDEEGQSGISYAPEFDPKLLERLQTQQQRRQGTSITNSVNGTSQEIRTPPQAAIPRERDEILLAERRKEEDDQAQSLRRTEEAEAARLFALISSVPVTKPTEMVRTTCTEEANAVLEGCYLNQGRDILKCTGLVETLEKCAMKNGPQFGVVKGV